MQIASTTPFAMATAADAEATRLHGFRELEREMSGGALAAEPPALDDFSFRDFLSIINPLQHIPVIGTIYRSITGDVIKPAARAIGGALFGGPIGLVAAVFNSMVEEATGKDLGEQALAAVMPAKAAAAPAAQLAASAAATDAAEPADKAAAEAAPPPAAAPEQAPAQAAAAAAVALPAAAAAASPAKSGAKDLAFYRNQAAARSASGPIAIPVAARFQPGATPPRVAPMAVSQPPQRAEAETKPRAASAGATDARKPVQESAVPQALAQPDGAPAAWFADQMMRGLDRYQSINRLSTPPRRLDRLE